MRPFAKYLSLTLALACVTAFNSPVRADAPAAQSETAQEAELLAGLFGAGLLADLFHSGSPSHSDSFSSPAASSGNAPSSSFSSGTSAPSIAAPVVGSSAPGIAPVPEASTSASLGLMLLLGGGGLTLIARRRRGAVS